MSRDLEMGNICLNYRAAAMKRILRRRKIKMLKEGLTPAVLEARYRKRMERIIAEYFFQHIHVLATGIQLSLYREVAKPGPVHPI